MATTIYQVQDTQGTTVGGVLTSNTAALPTFQPSFFPALEVQGFNGSITTSGSVISLVSGGQAFFVAYKACTLYLLSGSCTQSAQNVSFQPYGSPDGVTGAALIGTAKTVASTAAGNNAATFSQTQNIALSVGGYVGIGVTPTSNATFLINATLWVKQYGP